MRRILGIDPGSRDGLGWAEMNGDQTLHASGVIKTRAMLQDDRSELWGKLSSLLREFLEPTGKPPSMTAVAYERVHRHSGVHAAHIYGGQVAVIQATCSQFGVPWIPVQVATVKRFLRCSAAGKDKRKAMVDAARALGYTGVEDHNEADACGIALAGIDQWKTGKNVYGS